MPAVSYNPDNFYDPYGDPWNTDPGGTLSQRWWLNPWGIYGGMNPPPFGTAGQGGSAPGPRPVDPPMPEPTAPPPEPPLEQQPQQPTEGQTTETPEGTPPAVDESGTPTWSTDVWGDTWKLPLGGIALGGGLLGAGLAGLAGSGSGADTGGGTTPNYETTGWEVGDFPQAPLTPGGVTPPGTVPNFETTGWEVGDFPSSSPIGGTSFQTGPMNSLVSPPTGGGGGFPVSLFPWLNQLPNIITGGGGGGGGGSQQPQQPSQGGQQGQQGQQQTGNLLAQLPLLAAFQGGTTTTPAPYAHLGPHTPVAPTFKPQGPGKRIPSIGQLLAGVK